MCWPKQTNAQTKIKARGITFPNFKLYYKVTIMKTIWYWQKNRHTDQRNRIENAEINPHIWSTRDQLDKGVKKTHCGKDS